VTSAHRRGVTRGYVWGLIFAVVVVAFALMLMAWAGIALATGGGPVATPGVGYGVSAFIVVLCLGLLVLSLWKHALLLLRGRKTLSLGNMLIVSFGAYLLWGIVGSILGLSVGDAWLSLYALALALAWACAMVLFWALLLRRVYTDRPAPRWPWERSGDLGPDWAHTEEDPWDETSEDDRGERP